MKAARHHLVYTYVSLEEISRLREAERLVQRRVDLAKRCLSPEQRAIEAGKLRIDELAFAQRYY